MDRKRSPRPGSPPIFTMALLVVLTTADPCRAAGPAPGAATASITVAGKRVALTHAVAFNAGARIYLLVTDQALPPDKVKSEFELGVYKFQHRVVGLQVTLDSSRKVTEMAYMWEQGTRPCAGCFEVTVEGGAEGPLAGAVKSTPKGLEAKVEASGAYSAPFSRPSSGKE